MTGPYSPPKARVSDVDPERGPRPPQVRNAVALILVSIVLGFANSTFDPAFWQSMREAPVIGWSTLAATVAIVALLALFIAWGHNWARIVFLILTALGTVMILPGIVAAFATWWPTAIVMLVQTGLQFAALYLVFTRPGSAWFRR